MYKISLRNLEFYSFHGVYQEENLIGNVFVVDIFVSMPDIDFMDEDLNTTVNYVNIFQIAKQEMSITRKLLETVVKNIHDKVKELDSRIISVEVVITKKHVPIEGMIGQSQVSYSS